MRKKEISTWLTLELQRKYDKFLSSLREAQMFTMNPQRIYDITIAFESFSGALKEILYFTSIRNIGKQQEK